MPLDIVAWDKAGVVGVLVFVLILIVTGQLVPGWWFRRALAEKDKRIELLESVVRSAERIGSASESLIRTVESAVPDRKDGEQP